MDTTISPIAFSLDQLPERLSVIAPRTAPIWIAGQLDDSPVIAIVGTRKPAAEASKFARSLAAAVVGAGGVVASGGARGIDAAAHRGAIDGGGRTWAVAATGCMHVYPPEHAALYAEIVATGGAMIWPSPPHQAVHRAAFSARNRVLVALAHAVVIVQAGIPSGALNAAKWCRSLARPLYVVPTAPWMAEGFEGSMSEIARGARVLTSTRELLRDVGLGGGRHKPARHPSPGLPSGLPTRALTPDEAAVLAALTLTPRHVDEIAAKSQLAAHLTTTALLTLALEDVLVEGPAGFFRRANPA